MNTTTLSRASLAAGLFAVAGCITGEVPIGEDEQALFFAPPPDAAGADPVCEAFCAAAGAKDCPRTGDCLAICALERATSPWCEPELDAYLACAGEALSADTCSLAAAPVEDDPEATQESGCFAAELAYTSCARSHPDSNFQVLRQEHCPDQAGYGAVNVEPGRIESDEATCALWYGATRTLDVVCREGECDCIVDGTVQHTCSNLVSSLYVSIPGTGCCGRFFDGLPWP